MRKFLLITLLFIFHSFWSYSSSLSVFSKLVERAGGNNVLNLGFDNGDTIVYTGKPFICDGNNKVLTVGNVPSGSTVQWFKDSFAIQNADQSTYTATSGGNYSANVTNAGITQTYQPVNIQVLAAPEARFSRRTSASCSAIQQFFTDESIGNNLTYLWTFGDPNSLKDSSTKASARHYFIGTPGNGTEDFTVTLTVTNEAGCSSTVQHIITLNQSPSAELVLANGEIPVIYDKIPYFSECSSFQPTEFKFKNNSSTKNTNQSYQIIWGDGSPSATPDINFDEISHIYKPGSIYQLVFNVVGANGCASSTIYRVIIGTKPAINAGVLVKNTYDINESVNFPVTGANSNSNYTFYRIDYGDGIKNNADFKQENEVFKHSYTKSSFGQPEIMVNGVPYKNAYPAYVRTYDYCNKLVNAEKKYFEPIYVSDPQEAKFNISNVDPICVSESEDFTFTDTLGYSVNATGQGYQNRIVWKITPSTYTITKGDIGSDNSGSLDPLTWTPGAKAISIKFNEKGSYTVTLLTGTANAIKTATKSICVNAMPSALFTVDNLEGCQSLLVKTTNKSLLPTCGNNTFKWSVNYSNSNTCVPDNSSFTYANGNESSEAPEFSFDNPGVYTIGLIVASSGGCISSEYTQNITVYPKSVVTLQCEDEICQGNNINPIASVNKCYSKTSTTYLWTFPGGTPASSTAEEPGAIAYNSAGDYTFSLVVTNKCGPTTINKTIHVNPLASVDKIQDQKYCSGSKTADIVFTGTETGTIYNWSSSNTSLGLPLSGVGNISAFTTTNFTDQAITSTITITPSINACPGNASSFTITVYPSPQKPAVIANYNYCLNDPVNAISASATPGNILKWYSDVNLQNSIPAPIPSTATAGTNTYYVTQQNEGGCESPASEITFAVNPLITNNRIEGNQSVCFNTDAEPLTPAAGSLEGSNTLYQYQWQSSLDGINWNDISGAIQPSFSPGKLNQSINYRRKVSSGACTDFSNSIAIQVQNQIEGFDIQSDNMVVKQNTNPPEIIGQQAIGGNSLLSYQWESSLDRSIWRTIEGATQSNYQPEQLKATTHFRRITSSETCLKVSSSVTITVLKDEANNTFTPNGDGINDTWDFASFVQPSALITVFNRYGQVVFSCKNSQTPWDGESRGNKLPAGVYYYLITESNEKQLRGCISIIY